MKYIIIIIIAILIPSGNKEISKFHYIDSIDKIKNLESLSEKYINLEDTLQAINILIEITEIAEFSDIYGDRYISDYFYKIGNLYLLINKPILIKELNNGKI